MRYARIVFADGDDYDTAEAYVESALAIDGFQSWQGVMVEYLSQWETGEEEITDSNGHGLADTVTHVGDYILTYNLRMGYAALARKVYSHE